MSSGFNYKEYEKWAHKLEISDNEFQIWLKQFLIQQAQRVVASCKERQRAVGAIDTGAMINSWYIGGPENIALSYDSNTGSFDLDTTNSAVVGIDMVGDELEVEIGNAMDYASFIEYGHHSYSGKYILTISMQEVYNAMPSRFNQAWQQWVKAKGIV